MKICPKTQDKKKKSLSSQCIIHVDGLKEYGEIGLFSEKSDPEVRLNRLQDVKVRRQAQPAGSPNRMDAACRLIPQVIEAHHGYHIACYKCFTGNLNRLNVVETVQEPSTSSTRSKRNPSKKKLFDPDCIFYNSTHLKRVKKEILGSGKNFLYSIKH